MKRDGLLILLDEFDVLPDKIGLGSLIKSLSSSEVKFAICGIARDLSGLVSDHASVERLIEEGAIHVQPMPDYESEEIVHTAERLFRGQVTFAPDVISEIVRISEGYPYFVHLIGKECVTQANRHNASVVDQTVLRAVLNDIVSGRAFPTLENAYLRAIGNSPGRELLLHLLAELPDDSADIGKVALRNIRKDAHELDVSYMDQLIPRLIDAKFGPVLIRDEERQGVYEFVNPVLRLYCKLRGFVYP